MHCKENRACPVMNLGNLYSSEPFKMKTEVTQLVS